MFKDKGQTSRRAFLSLGFNESNNMYSVHTFSFVRRSFEEGRELSERGNELLRNIAWKIVFSPNQETALNFLVSFSNYKYTARENGRFFKLLRLNYKPIDGALRYCGVLCYVSNRYAISFDGHV